MKVLLPIDGSIYSDRAIEYICEHSSLRAKTDTVYLLNVQKKLPSELASKLPNPEEILDEAAKKILKPAKKALEAAGYKVKMKVAYGKATNRIVEYAQEIPATLIVMGSHGHTPVKGILLVLKNFFGFGENLDSASGHPPQVLSETRSYRSRRLLGRFRILSRCSDFY